MVDIKYEAEVTDQYGGENRKNLKVQGADGSYSKGPGVDLFDVSTLRGPTAVPVTNKGVHNPSDVTKSDSNVDGKCGIPC